jgi:3-hydroxyisobutyrate dehydrogenase-like beta-hydroxyacid dehydrogenase
MDVGMIGLGQMGAGIARNLLKAGHRVRVWNRTRARCEPLLAAGAEAAASPADAAAGDAVVTMLADDAAVEAVLRGDGGLLAGRGGTIHVSMSTISVALAARLAAEHAAAGRRYVAAPVFGRPAAAAAGELSVVAAGEPAAVEAVRPLFAAVGQRTFVVGTRPEDANVVKLAGNFMLMSAIETLSEALALAAKRGVAPGVVLDVLTGTLFPAPVYRNYGRLMLEENYRPAGFALPLGLKDMNLVSAAANDARVPMPVLAVLRDQLLATLVREGDDVDWSAIARTVAVNAGVAR